MQKIGDITDTADGNGEFTDGNVAGNVQPTELMAAWFNSVQRELLAVLKEAGITPDKTNDAQLIEAIQQILATGIAGSGYLISENNLSDLKDASEALGHLGLDNVGNWQAVQANGGKHSSGKHRIYMDWNDGDRKLYITVDETDVGELFTTQNPPNAAQTGAYPMTGGNLADDASITVMSGLKDGNAGQALYTPMLRVTMKGRGCDMDFKDGASACFRLVEVISNYAYAEILVDGWGSVRSFQFRNDGTIRSPSSVYAGQGFIAPDGNIYGPMWGGYLNNWVVAQINALNIALNQSINNVANTANDAWNKGNDAQLNRVQDVALGARWTGVLPGGGGLESPAAGYVMTGWYTEGQNPGGDTLVFRPVQKYVPSMGWVNVGHTA
jgi:hypothetical protein